MTNSARNAYLFLFVICLIAISFLYLSNEHPATPENLEFKSIDGRTLTLEEHRGRPVLINFWSTSCAACVEEMPDLFTIYNEFSPEGFEILSVAMSYDPPDIVLAMAKSKNIPYPVILDISAEISKAFGQIKLIPTHYLISPEGKIVEFTEGKIDPARLRDQIKQLLSL